MKKLYISLGLIAMGSAAFAQQLTPLQKSPAKRTFSRAEVSPTTIIARQEKPTSEITGNRVVVLEEDFQTSGAVPTALPSGWTTNTVSQTECTLFPFGCKRFYLWILDFITAVHIKCGHITIWA